MAFFPDEGISIGKNNRPLVQESRLRAIIKPLKKIIVKRIIIILFREDTVIY